MNQIKTAYAVKHKDERVRSLSRSGGVFTALSDVILARNGTVYGCALDDQGTARAKLGTRKEIGR